MEASKKMQIDEYPRPHRDSGCGTHWFPTVTQRREFAGDLINIVPPEAQMKSVAILLAHLLQELGLSMESIIGHKETVATQCPGNQWLAGKKWMNMRPREVQAVTDAVQHSPEKPIKPYVLFYSYDGALGAAGQPERT